MSKNLKVPSSYSQQVQLLQNKNIIIENSSECIDFLSKVNFYRLSGYLLPFKSDLSNSDKPVIPFSRITEIYFFDAELRNLLSATIETIEIYIRAQLSYHSAINYGADGYMDVNNYNRAHKHPDFMARVSKCIRENRNSLVVKHHVSNYGGKFPIWVIVDYFSLGMLSYFYTGMKNRDKSTLAASMYATNYQTMSSWLRCLTDLRNRCAHYSRLYYWIFPAIPKMPKGTKLKPNRSLFYQLYMLKLMYPTPAKWEDNFLKPLRKLISKYKGSIVMNHIGFPYRWYSILKN